MIELKFYFLMGNDFRFSKEERERQSLSSPQMSTNFPPKFFRFVLEYIVPEILERKVLGTKVSKVPDSTADRWNPNVLVIDFTFARGQ